MRPLDQYIKDQLDKRINELESLLNSDIMSILSPLTAGLEYVVKDAL